MGFEPRWEVSLSERVADIVQCGLRTRNSLMSAFLDRQHTLVRQLLMTVRPISTVPGSKDFRPDGVSADHNRLIAHRITRSKIGTSQETLMNLDIRHAQVTSG